MRVDRSYKGGAGKTIELFDSGMCDGPRFELGHQYLMYTEGLPSQMVPARGAHAAVASRTLKKISSSSNRTAPEQSPLISAGPFDLDRTSRTIPTNPAHR